MKRVEIAAALLLVFAVYRCTGASYTCPKQSPPNTKPSIEVVLPRECEHNVTECDYYLALTPNANNDSYLDIYLEANATGWVAVGFSLDTLMFNDDVLGCQHDPSTSKVHVVDAWNPSQRHHPNQIDPNQDGVCAYEGQYSDGRISCSFSRYYGIVNPGFDWDLKERSYHLLQARSDTGANGTVNFPYHTPVTPTPTEFTVNAFAYNNSNKTVEYKCPTTSFSIAEKNVVLSIPSGCSSKPSTCDYYIAMGPNPQNDSFVDIHLEGTADGWIAVGFSNDTFMFNDDVLGCKYDSTADEVYAIDTWNPPPRHTPNEIDPTQDGMCLYGAEKVDGRISCNFSRYAGVVNVGYDVDLRDSYYLLLGRRQSQGGSYTGFPKHSFTPFVSENEENAYLSNNTGGVDSFELKMLKTHGILMVIAFPVLVVCAAFIAAWTRPLFGQEGWFQAHRAFMLFALVLSCAAFAIVFIANKDNPTPGLMNLKACGAKTSHFVIGITVMFLMLVNPLVSLLRCKPDSPQRWIYNLAHGQVIGGLTVILALVNIGLGLYIFQTNCDHVTARNNTMLWIYLGWAAFFVATQLTLFGVFTSLSSSAPSIEQAALAPSLVKLICYRDQIHEQRKELPYQKLNEEEETVLEKFNKVCSIRIGALVVFVGVTVMAMLALVIMIALGIHFAL